MNKYLVPYVHLVDFLGNFLGEDYEIVLHETGKENRVVAIANSEISGRSVGSPLTNMAQRMIQNKEYETKDYVSNYVGVSPKGHALRSSTFFIKDPAGKLIGLICVNFDDSKYRKVEADLLALCHPTDFFKSTQTPLSTAEDVRIERFPVTSENAIDEAIQTAVENSGVAIGHMTQDEKISVIEMLQKAGIFKIKGAVEQVANSLFCSQASVYRYLSTIRKKKQ